MGSGIQVGALLQKIALMGYIVIVGRLKLGGTISDSRITSIFMSHLYSPFRT
jgi:hypothetical protein